jgi:hypothetical protein
MKGKIAFWIITLILTAVVLYISVVTVVQPVFTKNPLPRVTGRSSEAKEKTSKGEIKAGKGDKDKVTRGDKDKVARPDLSVAGDDDTVSSSGGGSNSPKESINKLIELRKKEILLRSRLALASEDSTYLILDLINNMAVLELKGIPLHECKILHTEISNSFKSYPKDVLLNWMSEPFVLKNVDATIPKISFIEKIAPKDTLEANKMVTEPKEAKFGDVYVVMDFDRNLRLVMSQIEQPDADGLKLISEMKQKYHKIEVSRSIKALTKFNREPVKPQIEIIIPKSDATILYKALPLNPRMILRM